MAKLVLNVGFQHQMPDFVIVAPDPKHGQTPDRKLPVVWLLHDFGGDGEDWCRYGQLELIAKNRDILFVCPNSRVNYYQDSWKYFRYQSLIMDEIWDFVNRTFPVSELQEDRLIIGSGMGGYGSLFYALAYPGRFGTAVSLDGDVNAYERFLSGSTEKFVFPNTFAKDGTDHSIAGMSSKADRNMNILLACRKSSDTWQANKALYVHMKENGLPVSFTESEAAEPWPFWSGTLSAVISKAFEPDA